MPEIRVLSKDTIDKIAAGEVIERPASIVKELVENAIDAKASAITVEIKEGGTTFIRITDNGCGIPKDEVPIAFLRHSTSKIRKADDLVSISSLGFRGEALSSISAVSQVELITKTRDEFTGIRYVIEGGVEKTKEEIGAPEGTTFLVRNLFYNTPARKKFLKSAQTEGGYIQDLMERLALSHPDISFKLINGTQTKLHTLGNGNLKDIIYQIFGREIAANLLEVRFQSEQIQIQGFIGKPIISRGNRQYENYFINGRYVKSSIISKSIEQAYKSFLMQHKYPFTVLLVTLDGRQLDVNVHPTKMELRFSNGEQIFQLFYKAVHESLHRKELIPSIQEETDHKNTPKETVSRIKAPEPFEKKRIEIEKNTLDLKPKVMESKPERVSTVREEVAYKVTPATGMSIDTIETPIKKPTPDSTKEQYAPDAPEQLVLFEDTNETRSLPHYQIIGQVFQTYWIVQVEDKMFMIDQHAAHEKILYERMMKQLKEKEHTSQLISPPIILSLSETEAELLKQYQDSFEKIGFAIEAFGGKEYAIREIPANMYNLNAKELFLEILDGLYQNIGRIQPDMITEKIASMSCKAAVKGNQSLSVIEAEQLIRELMTLDNPYNCPHGRPVIVSMTKTELEKKFKRIV